MLPKISVITGFYNRSFLLERTIESILKQTWEDFELIVFDDASTDGGAERLLELARIYDDPRIRPILHRENQGFVLGLRQAIDVSRGEYIAIQGSGDASLPKRLEFQAKLLDVRPEVGAVGGWYYNVDESSGSRRIRTQDAGRSSFGSLLHKNVFSHGEVMIRRSTYELVGGYRAEFANSQDYDLWLRISKVAELATVPEPIYLRYAQLDGVSYSPRKVVLQSCYTVAARRMAMMPSNDEARVLMALGDGGPTAVVPFEDRAVQREIRRAVTRLVFFGSRDDATKLARESVRNPLIRVLLLSLVRVYSAKLFVPFSKLLDLALGIERA